MTAADRVQEAPRPHGAPGRHSAFGAASERRAAGRRPTAWIVAPSVFSAVLAAAAIFIVVNGAHSAGYRISGGTMTTVYVLGALILAVVVATLALAGRPGRTAEFVSYPEAERRQPPQAPHQSHQPHQPHQQQPPMPQQAPAPLPQRVPPQAPPPPPVSPQVVANATEAAATLAAATRAAAGPASVSDEGVDLQVIFAQLVRRLLTLVLQQINRLDELENEVEDPKLLKSLFGIDHQATQVRRYGENIGVLVGALPQRQWTHPVPVTVAQRSAVSETPDYPRVQVIPRAPGRIHGHAVSDVIHILSELVENATNYSNPTTKVTVGAHRVSAGLAIEINDHGIGMEPDQFRRLNTLLRDPSGANVRDLLSQGRIGLSVVAKMAQRHGIAVELAPNVTGGTMALVVIPDALLATEELPADRNRQPRRGIDTTQLPARPALVSLPDAVTPAPAAAPSSAASLSPVAASTLPLPAPATSQVPPLPTADDTYRLGQQNSVRAASQDTAQAGSSVSSGSSGPSWAAAPPLPTALAGGSETSSSGFSWDALSTSTNAADEASSSGSGWDALSSPSTTSSLSGTADQSSRPAPATSVWPAEPRQPQHSQSASATPASPASPATSSGSQPSYSQSAQGLPIRPQPAPAEPQWPSTTPPTATGGPAPVQAAPVPRPTGSAAYPQPSAGQYPGQGPGAGAPPWSQAGAPQQAGQPGSPQASQPGPQPQPGSAPGLLPDGRPQLRRRTPQGHISARLIQAEGQESRPHDGGALSPTMMSDFWQGLSSGTAPADPPAAGPDPSQHDRTTANRQEWNQ
ncbi:hypothetical protein ABH920_000642 [Catenulispora sp. EB89]|uniref:sensor histidine kinase n=1 Tax=Catenulispora sp. EB89 TaxID=3156257 RepID=UPI003512F644